MMQLGNKDCKRHKCLQNTQSTILFGIGFKLSLNQNFDPNSSSEFTMFARRPVTVPILVIDRSMATNLTKLAKAVQHGAH